MNTSTKRQQLLDTGVMFAVRYFRDPQRSLKQGLGFLSPTEIADQVGCSRSLIYHLWAVDDATDRGAAFEAYLGDVAEQMSRELLPVEPVLETIQECQDASTSLDEMVRSVCEHELRTIVGDELRALALTDLQLRTVAVDSTRVRESFRQVDDEQRKQLAEAYGGLLARFGLDLRQGLTLDHLARTLWTVSYGFVISTILEPAEASTNVSLDGEQWSLYALAVRGVLSSFLLPAS
jgi:AcrR family transcriptional regulator